MPPAPACATSTTVQIFSASGTCVGGVCKYPSSTLACEPGEVCLKALCKWNDPSLSALTVSQGTLAFKPTQTTYVVSVPNGSTTVLVTPTLPKPTRATMNVNDSAATSGSAVNVTVSTVAATVSIQVTAEGGATRTYTVIVTALPEPPRQQAYIKASNTGAIDLFGDVVAISADGNTLAVGAVNESSNARGVNGNQADNSAQNSGAVYVFTRSGNTWAQQAYVKASNTGPSDEFGSTVALSADGNTLAVGAARESSSATGVNGNQADNSAPLSGAVYIFTRQGTAWAQQAYVKASNTEFNDNFGRSVALSADGNTLAVGASGEDSSASGVNGNQSDNSVLWSGAAYIFTRSGSSWVQQGYLKASNPGNEDHFGGFVALAGDGNTVAIAASSEDSGATGVNGNQASNSAGGSGAVYVFTRKGALWEQQAYLKASNTGLGDNFGISVTVSNDGNTLVVGADGEDSNATGVNGNQADNSPDYAGAVYVFTRNASTWAQQAYLKASNTKVRQLFGISVAISADGNTLAIGASWEGSSATGVNGNQADNSASQSGAVYLFTRNGATWAQQDYLKSSNSEAIDVFGHCVALSADGNTLAVGAQWEDSGATGVNGNQADNSMSASGAVYVFAK